MTGLSTTGKGRFSLSQRVVVVALVSVSPVGSGGRRHLLVSTGGQSPAPTTSQATFNLGVGLEDLVADQLNLPAHLVLVWSIAHSLTKA